VRVGTGELAPGVRTRGLGPGVHGSLPEAGPESSDRRVGTKEFGAESWDRGSVRSLPEVGPQSSDLRVGTRDLRPEIWGQGGTGVRQKWNRCWEQRVGTISWDQRIGTRCGCVADDANSDAFLFM
jgi:hypothetical protein